MAGNIKSTYVPDTQAQRSLKAKANRKIAMANKRLTRLEKNDLTELPAYQSFLKNGGQRFSVAGKSYNELQSEIARVNQFLDAKTSLVRGANKYLKEIARTINLPVDKRMSLPNQLSGFFQVASQIEQYLRGVEQSASAIGYQKIWEVINKYVQTEEISFNEMLKEYSTAQEEILKLLAVDIAQEGLREASTLWNPVN